MTYGIGTFNNFEELRAIPSVAGFTAQTVCKLRSTQTGHRTLADSYLWDPNAVDDDNDSTVIAVTVNGANPGRFRRNYSNLGWVLGGLACRNAHCGWYSGMQEDGVCNLCGFQN